MFVLVDSKFFIGYFSEYFEVFAQGSVLMLTQKSPNHASTTGLTETVQSDKNIEDSASKPTDSSVKTSAETY